MLQQKEYHSTDTVCDNKRMWVNRMRYPERNCYDSLGVPRNASAKQIKQAYREQMKYFHPDVYPGSPEIADAKSKELNAAYELLSSPLERERYDRWLDEQERQAAYERAKKQEEERRKAEEQARKEEEERQKASEQAQKEAEEAFYNTWWHEYAAYEAERAETERRTKTEEAWTKHREKWTRRLAFWKKVQLVITYMFLAFLPVTAVVYYLFPTSEKLLVAVLPPYAWFILIGAHVSSFVVRHLEEKAL